MITEMGASDQSYPRFLVLYWDDYYLGRNPEILSANKMLSFKIKFNNLGLHVCTRFKGILVFGNDKILW